MHQLDNVILDKKKNIHNIKKTQENTEHGRHYAKHQMQTKN